MRETLRFSGKILSATISRAADQWFTSITVDTSATLSASTDSNHASTTLSNHLPPAENQGDALSLSKGVVGVDLGVSALATLTLHQLTTDLTRRFHTIGIEDLNVSGMVKNRHLSRAISDMGFFEFRRQLEYKADMRGGVVVVADRFFASSKTCSACGYKLEKLPLLIRQWDCLICGTSHDRDVNAAINLANHASAAHFGTLSVPLSNHAVSYTVSACGGEGSGLGRKPKTKPAPVKQEFDSKLDDVQVCISSK